jgi:hypothetical protein
VLPELSENVSLFFCQEPNCKVVLVVATGLVCHAWGGGGGGALYADCPATNDASVSLGQQIS